MNIISPLLGAIGLSAPNGRGACPSVATVTRSVTSTFTNYVTAQHVATVTGAPRCTETFYGLASVLTVPRVQTHTKTATATTTSYSTSDFAQLVTDVHTLLTADTTTTTVTNTQTNVQTVPATVTATTLTTVTSTTTAPTPTQTQIQTCEAPGGLCTIDDFIEVCCAAPDGSVGCSFPSGDPQNGQCFMP